MPLPQESDLDEYLRFLIVDDDELAILEIRKLLLSLGISRFQSALNGQAALDIIRQSSAIPDVIILDLRMPVMGGMDFIQRLHELRYSSRIIIHSGADQDIVDAVCQLYASPEYNILGTLAKPLQAEKLLDLLRRLDKSA